MRDLATYENRRGSGSAQAEPYSLCVWARTSSSASVFSTTRSTSWLRCVPLELVELTFRFKGPGVAELGPAILDFGL